MTAVTTRRSLLDRFLELGQPRFVHDLSPAPREIAPGLWSMDRVLRMPGGPRLPVRSTVIRLRSGGLLVVAPPPLEAGGFEALEAHGQIEEVLAPNSFHYLGAANCLARHPRARFRTVPGLHARVPGLPASEELTDAAPAPWAGVLEHALLGPVRGVTEVALFHLPSATLILTDVAFHVRRYETGLERAFWRFAGVPAGFGPSRSARWILLRDRTLARAFLERVAAWPFRRVLVAHGDPLETDARDVFRKAFLTHE
jgi:hypothetical protein